MAVLTSTLEPTSDRFQIDRSAMLAALAELEVLAARVLTAGGERAVAKHWARGSLLARERIDLLLDQDAPFLELSMFAGAHEPDEQPGGRLITGIGPVSRRRVRDHRERAHREGRIAQPVLGGAPAARARHRRAQPPARDQLGAVGRSRSPRQEEIFVNGGRIFRELTRLSAAGIPTIALVFGSSTAGGAYVPGMSEYTVFVKEQAAVYLGGPPLVKMATGEDVDDETLGGAEMHARASGLADYLAVDERDALRIGRQIIADLGWRKQGPGPSLPADEPLFPAEELLSCAAAEARRSFEVRDVLARILDGSRFDEFKPLYGTQLVCGWGSLHGFPVGVLANNGILFSEESQKGAHFIQLANARDTPLLFVQNITGFMVGSAVEQGGIIKDGAKLINAVSNSAVPHLTLMIGASYGAGNYGMSGRAFDPRFVFTWPNHRIAVMGGTQLAGVMSIIQRAAAERRGPLRRDHRRRGPRRVEARSRRSRARSSPPVACGTTGSSTRATPARSSGSRSRHAFRPGRGPTRVAPFRM